MVKVGEYSIPGHFVNCRRRVRFHAWMSLNPLTSRPKSHMFFRRMQQDSDFPTETHQKLGFDFFVFLFRIALWYITIKPPSGRICLELFPSIWSKSKEKDDLTSEYLTGHAMYQKKHLPPFQRLRDCWLLLLSVIERVTMTSIFVYRCFQK